MRDDPEGRAAAHQPPAGKTYLSVRHAAFIGFGAMIGAGIFTLLGAAAEVARVQCDYRF